MRGTVGPWTLADLAAGKVGSPKHGLKVFSAFHCGGGSTMGYKLAGYDVMGGVEIDPEMMAVYRKNHSPRHSFLEGVQDFVKHERYSLPLELFELDILDGSPPCSSFSMAGARDRDWGKEKKFREGQADQVLDDLFFHFIAMADMLRPRMVVAENVKGLVMGKARGYVAEIFAAFDRAGYEAQLFLLNASRMGVPQARERTFFIARRKDLGLPRLRLEFDEPEITVGEAFHGLTGQVGKPLPRCYQEIYPYMPPGTSGSAVKQGSYFQAFRLDMTRPAPTITAQWQHKFHPTEMRTLSPLELCRLQSFPDDFDFCGLEPGYVIGMSVPPLMMERVAWQVYLQILQGA